jgi:hypothetical protein
VEALYAEEEQRIMSSISSAAIGHGENMWWLIDGGELDLDRDPGRSALAAASQPGPCKPPFLARLLAESRINSLHCSSTAFC